jgi:flagellar protein FliJ
MKGIASLIRVHRWKLDEKRRELSDLQDVLDDFMKQLVKLEQEMAREQTIARDNQDVGYSYANYSQAARDRQLNLNSSIEEIQGSIEIVEDEVAELYQELKKYEITKDTREKKARMEQQRKDQIALDDLSLDMYRRKK